MHTRRNYMAQAQIKDINSELSIALQHLPASVSESVVKGMINPSNLDTNYVHRGLNKRPQYSCGYCQDLNYISIYFHHSDPTPKDTVTDLNIEHKEIILNEKRFNVHSGFFNYLFNNKDNKFINNIIFELETLKNKYNYDVTSIDSNTRLILTGQSLGSALSQLFYLLTYSKSSYYKDYQQRLMEVIPRNIDNVFVITFGSPSFMFYQNVAKHFKKEPNTNSDQYRLCDLDKRIFNFHDENDPIPLLITGNNDKLQSKNVSFREVVRCSPVQRLEIASNTHLGNNFLLTNDKCINMEQDNRIKETYLQNGANYLWNEKINNMRQLLTLFALNHFPHHYKQRVQKFLENPEKN